MEWGPRQTLALDRVFNRAVTQVIFTGRKQMFCKDLIVSLLSETSSHAAYILKKNGASRDKVVKIIEKDFYDAFANTVNRGQPRGMAGGPEGQADK